MKIATLIPIKDCDIWRLSNSLKAHFAQERELDELIVVDFGSSKNNREKYKKIISGYNVRYFEINDNTELFHPARIGNFAINKTTSDILCYTDVDIIPDNSIYKVIEKTLLEDPYRLIMCSRLDLPKESNKNIDFVKDFDIWWDRCGGKANHPAPGSFQCLPVSWLKRVGGYNETLIGWGGYDEDIKRRALRAGFEQYWIDRVGVKLIHIFHEPREYIKHTNIHKNSTTVTNFRGVKLLPNGKEDRR